MTKKPISSMSPSVKRPVFEEQVILLVLLMRELAEAYRRPHRRFRDLPEYRRLLHGAYACGFVCRDIDPLGEYLEVFQRNPDAVRRADFVAIRRYVHTLLRAERHSDCGEDEGGGHIIEAVRSGALLAVAERLENEPDWRE